MVSSSDQRGHSERHVPVMLGEVIDGLAPRDGAVYVDGTFGAGGYTRAILEAADCVVIALDRDPSAIAEGEAMARQFAGRLTLVNGRFADTVTLLEALDVTAVDGVVLDLGVSSMQLDRAERGFSLRADGPLDMRMEGAGPSAGDVVNGLDEGDLSRLIAVLGEERHARRIARAIVVARKKQPLTRTGQLANLIAEAAGPAAQREKIHPATRTFQALRIYVNGELEQLVEGLHAAERLLRPGGRLVVVAFHSLEDRIVKRFLAARTRRAAAPSRHMPEPTDAPEPSFRAITRGALRPSEAETGRNPRARSARLRAAERTGAAALPLERRGLGLPGLGSLRGAA